MVALAGALASLAACSGDGAPPAELCVSRSEQTLIFGSEQPSMAL